MADGNPVGVAEAVKRAREVSADILLIKAHSIDYSGSLSTVIGV